MKKEIKHIRDEKNEYYDVIRKNLEYWLEDDEEATNHYSDYEDLYNYIINNYYDESVENYFEEEDVVKKSVLDNLPLLEKAVFYFDYGLRGTYNLLAKDDWYEMDKLIMGYVFEHDVAQDIAYDFTEKKTRSTDSRRRVARDAKRSIRSTFSNIDFDGSLEDLAKYMNSLAVVAEAYADDNRVEVQCKWRSSPNKAQSDYTDVNVALKKYMAESDSKFKLSYRETSTRDEGEEFSALLYVTPLSTRDSRRVVKRRK